jgi:hypothetical protein
MPSDTLKRLVNLRQAYMLNAIVGQDLGEETKNEIGRLQDQLSTNERLSYDDYLGLEGSEYKKLGSVAGAYDIWLKREEASDALTPLAEQSTNLKRMSEIIVDYTQRNDLVETLPPSGAKLH